MTEKQITICGHGSGTPSIKNMFDYLESRRTQKATNGRDKGLVCVVRFLKTEEQRKQFSELYKTLIGRNRYNQNLRRYVYEPYKGVYYSDCSSSGCYTFDKCGVAGVRDYNTAAMYNAGEKVDVRIENGHINDNELDKLRVGDCLLFRGNDPSRPLQIGHVEYVFTIPTGDWYKEAGKWYYKEAGEPVKNDWRLVNHHWYYFGANGVMLTGWHTINGEWYYLEESGDYEGACWHEKNERKGSLERWYVD